ncbi:AraC family transcriptional regulator [Haloactinospora alba]|uniref:AraC family transcriptional regulator n=1 Tax=Haloactinospora alba TaxID=405555 RepID=A0A543NLX2_9ACTN|nr:helix-turn-helix domain-containing protein [Haloactinospora alba]TQN32812.1 AraC family transcriptional regulator [Haloactinospora alba]
MPHPYTGWVTALPHPALRNLVRRYTGYTQHGAPPGVHRGLPSRHVTLVVSFTAPIRVVDGPSPGHAPVTARATVSGLRTRPTLLAREQHQCGVQVELDPPGIRALLGVPAADLAGAAFDVADLPNRWGGDLAERLSLAPSWDGVFAVLDTVFTGSLTPVRTAPEVLRAWRVLLASGGTVPVAGLAREVSWSRRHLNQRFGREMGVSPKRAARLVRFERCCRLLRAGNRDLARVAAECGYYDQAHLAGDWREFAGCSPTAWLREELPLLRDTAGAVPG